MNSTLSTLLAVAVFLILPLLGGVFLYNNLVNKEEQVFSTWAQVESNYQRRADLIPNLVKTVSAYLEHERSTLQEVTEARRGDGEAIERLIQELQQAHTEIQQATDTSTAPDLADPAFLQSFDRAQNRLGRLVGRLLVTVEDYPNLRASDQMLALQAQLEGTENRINVARLGFNQSVEAFNRSIRVIPGSLMASLGNFKRKAYFKADNGASEAVQVDFQ